MRISARYRVKEKKAEIARTTHAHARHACSMTLGERVCVCPGVLWPPSPLSASCVQQVQKRWLHSLLRTGCSTAVRGPLARDNTPACMHVEYGMSVCTLWRAGKRGQRSRHTLDAPPLEYVPAVQEEVHVDAPARRVVSKTKHAAHSSRRATRGAAAAQPWPPPRDPRCCSSSPHNHARTHLTRARTSRM